MNLLRNRPLCLIGAALLFAAFVFLRIPSAALITLAVALSVLLLTPKLRKGPLPLLSLLLLLALCLSILFAERLPRAILSGASGEQRYTLTVSREVGSGRYIGTSLWKNGVPCPLARVEFQSDETLSVGDRVTLTASVRSVGQDSDSQGIHATLKVKDLLSVKSRAVSARAILDRTRRAIGERLFEIGGDELGALLSALLLGELDELPLGTSSAFRRLGLSHVLAVSGMHLLVIASLLSRLLVLFGMPKRARSILVSILLILYAAAVGGTPSILRALMMALVSQAAFFVGRRTDSLTSLFFSGAILAVASPRILLSLSFRLSFAATFGIVACAAVARRLALSEKFPRLLYRFIVFPALLSLFALVFTLPLTLSEFGGLSLAALAANLVFAPLYELLLCVGLLSLCIGPLLPIRMLVRGLGSAILSLTEWAADAPSLLLDASHPIVLSLFTLLALILLWHLLCVKTSRRAVCLTLLPTLGLLLLSIALLSFPTKENGRITLLGGDGDGELLVLSTGRDRAVIDCSPESSALFAKLQATLSADAVTELSFYLPAEYGEQTLSAVKRLANRYHLRLVLLPEPKSAREEALRNEVTEYLAREKIPYKALSDGQPSDGDYRLSLQKSTDSILLLRVGFGDTVASYLSGRAAGLLNDSDIPYSDVLILGSRGAAASRLPDTSRMTEHLVLCDEVYPQIYHSKRVTRLFDSLALDLN